MAIGTVTSPHVTAFTNLGPQASSQRIRLYEWLRRTVVPHTIWDYLGTDSSSPRQLLSQPLRLMRAETSLRRAARHSHDVALVLREASPLSRGATERRLLSRAEHGVYDFDDALQWDHGEGGLYRRLAPKAVKTEASVRAADIVIAGSDLLADWASGFNRHVEVIPTCIDVADYDPKVDYEVNDPPRFGWLGSNNNEVYLETIAEPLLRLHRRTGARLCLITGPRSVPLPTLEPMIDRLRWSLHAQRSILCTLDIGIMPLPDLPYERGKCGYKLLQYAAAGLLSVGSPVGANSHILSTMGMPSPATAGQWDDALDHLLSMSSVDRRQLAEHARRIAISHWSYDTWQHRWEAAVLGRSRPQSSPATKQGGDHTGYGIKPG